MPEVDAKLVQTLREQTGAGIMECKRALAEARGDIRRAVEILRGRGQKVVQAKQDRETREGRLGVYVHTNGKVGAIVALACETDFVARTEDFQTLARDLAMQVTASVPRYLRPEDIPAEVVAAESEIYARQMEPGKPASVREKIAAGKLEKFFAEVCLLKQPFIKDEGITVQQLLDRTVAKLGENIQITGFSRLTVG